MEFTPVPADRQDDIKSPQRAAWFKALLDNGMLEMTTRPTLTATQRDLLEAQGQRFRTRIIDGKCYVWVEDIESEDLAELPPISEAYEDEVPV